MKANFKTLNIRHGLAIIHLTIFIITASSYVYSQPKTIQERLGYSKDTKLVIIHADDLGVSHSENTASIAGMEKGMVSSSSIMVPCPWFGEMAVYSQSHPNADLGLHLTLTSEWKFYKWGPVLSNQVPSLSDTKGYLYDNVAELYKNAKLNEVESELRAQIKRAIQFGINPTHFDSHMGSALNNPSYLNIYIKLSREYKTPVLLNQEMIKSWMQLDPSNKLNDADVVFDRIAIANPEDYKKGMNEFYLSVLKSITPGLTYLILHTAYDNDEMQAVTSDHPDYGAAWRQADFNFFTSAACKQLIEKENIKVITWREIQKKFYK